MTATSSTLLKILLTEFSACDRKRRPLLYKAQIRLYLEYATLSWMWAASQSGRGDRFQRRALGLMDAADDSAQTETSIFADFLERRRDVAVFVFFHKTQVQELPHLA